MIATLIASELANWNSDARLYRAEPAIDGHHYVVVETWPVSKQFDAETHVYAAWPNGGAVAHPDGGLSPQRRYIGVFSHDEALAELGYQVVEPTPAQED
ncbi:hypothetical protein [Rhodococcoides fascians]|uniref:hypothetical protein n=1 Tax=Rhodococcoides fascians TaxID=1828 RepID=UPI00055BDE47|nr:MULTISPECIES: hypothetical protein [Rhodococcus]OZE98072.1 hypothetical protein CH301_17150 [Rhodococcus sp. 15-1189-1-1a]OZF12722.1 hypothetical protein CH299_17835 [Rhodococcus sp. 14-2686-1-2]